MVRDVGKGARFIFVYRHYATDAKHMVAANAKNRFVPLSPLKPCPLKPETG